MLIGADLRNPQLGSYLELDRKRKGLSEYLYNEAVEIKDISQESTVHPNLTLISSGSIPPNPTELLSSFRLETLIADLRNKYDYIVIDSAPLLLVTDTFLFSKMADITLYMLRSGYSKDSFPGFINDILKQSKLEKVGLILNDVKQANQGYGYSYSYGYGEEKPKLLQRITRKLAF